MRSVIVAMLVIVAAAMVVAMATAEEGSKAKAAVKTKAAEAKPAPAVPAAKAKPKPAYIGSAKCKMCHNFAKKGQQFKKWSAAKHSQAYTVLASEEAKKVAASLGIADAQKSGKCLKCHSTAYNFTESKVAAKVKVEEGVGCESCHGPGRRHVELARSENLRQGDIGLPSLSALNKDQSLNVCFQCHAVKDVLRDGYLPGMELERYYSLKLPILGNNPYLPDGRVASFAYQQNHLFSDCYLSGSMTCVDCHDPHSQDYRDINGNRLDGRFDDRQCTGCHAGKRASPEDHSHHAPDSPASRCTSCHMPFLQHRGIGGQLKFARSDHTISIPRPCSMRTSSNRV